MGKNYQNDPMVNLGTFLPNVQEEELSKTPEKIETMTNIIEKGSGHAMLEDTNNRKSEEIISPESKNENPAEYSHTNYSARIKTEETDKEIENSTPTSFSDSQESTEEINKVLLII